jgi:hypothetical protein
LFPVGVYNVEDYPLNWIDGTYYSTYKGNTFQVSSIENVKSEAEYDAVVGIVIRNENLTTSINKTFTEKFTSLTTIDFNANSCVVTKIAITGLQNAFFNFCDCSNLDLSSCINLTRLNAVNASVTDAVVNTINTIYLESVELNSNSLTTFDASSYPLLNSLTIHNNQLDNLVNSQILIDLDTNGLSDGYFRSSIFGGGSLTAAGQTAKSSLLSKGWTIVGI